MLTMKLAILAGGAFVFACVCGATAINIAPSYDPLDMISGAADEAEPEQLAGRCQIPMINCNKEPIEPIVEVEQEVAGRSVGCVIMGDHYCN